MPPVRAAGGSGWRRSPPPPYTNSKGSRCLNDVGREGNAQIDFELLAYLTWADIVVSNDEKFFAQILEEIWKPRGKRLMTAETLSEFVNRL